MIYCELEPELRWTKSSIISKISRTFRTLGNTSEQEVAAATTRETLQINKQALCFSRCFSDKWQNQIFRKYTVDTIFLSY